MTTCLVVQHLEPEKAYLIADALERHQVELEVCRVFAGDTVPPGLGGYDAVVVMGGPMSATSDEGFPTRRSELAMLGQALEHRLPILGVCLGAQLLAAAGGAKVYPGSEGAEIGWKPVVLSVAAADDPLFGGVDGALTVLHWHGDTFDLPAGAVHLASSQQYVNQAFRLGQSAWGLQFHLEVDAEAVAAFTGHFGDDAARAGVPLETIEGPARAALSRLAPVGRQVLDRFAAIVHERARWEAFPTAGSA
jgi:GMP synthase-like glutamine amidotransferase